MNEANSSFWLISLIGALVFSFIHLFTYKLKFLDVLPRSKWLSFAGGVSIAYIFMHLLPELEEMQHTFVEEQRDVESFFKYPLYLVALFSLSVYYGIERQVKLSGVSKKTNKKAETTEQESIGIFYFHISSFAIYNALIGYTLTREEWDTQSFVLFVLALSFHFVVNDFGFVGHYRHNYIQVGRWILGFAPLAGWLTGNLVRISEIHLGLVLAFIAGGTILNVLKEELPEERKSNFWAFLIGVILYSVLLLVMD
jgi:zinc transporter ZupT